MNFQCVLRCVRSERPFRSDEVSTSRNSLFSPNFWLATTTSINKLYVPDGDNKNGSTHHSFQYVQLFEFIGGTVPLSTYVTAN